MASLDDLPSLPSAVTLSPNDLLPILNLSDRRSPKKISVSQLLDLMDDTGAALDADVEALDSRVAALEEGGGGGAEVLYYATDDDKLNGDAELGQVAVITTEGGRVEQFVGVATIEVIADDESYIMTQDGEVNGLPRYRDINNSDNTLVFLVDGEDAYWFLEVGGAYSSEITDAEFPWLADWGETDVTVSVPQQPQQTNQSNWAVLRNTNYLFVTNLRDSSVSINGVEVLADSAFMGVGWVDPTSITTSDNFQIQTVSLYQKPPIYSGTELIASGPSDFYVSGGGGSFSIPFVAAPRGRTHLVIAP
jgi:hypothetical protein